ncbi:hypothetical protein Sjap_024076 [Stephania japonica]|uniref:Uncharacterized protein n=1 Tax=Stephania japonica TaxID=461633 RepID=A0AAP0HL56_9MAGN
MGEIDTKPIESVQTALFLFGEKSNNRKYRSTNSESKQEFDEKELDLILKDLSNHKVQLEVKESAYQQLLLKQELYEKTVGELSSQLRNCEADRNKYNEEVRTAQIQGDELQCQIKVITNQLSETGNIKENLLLELKSTQEDLRKARAEVASAVELKVSAMKQIELLESASAIENGKTMELFKRVEELNEGIRHSKLAAIEAEKEKTIMLTEKEVELETANATAVQLQEQLEDLKKQIDMMPYLENEIIENNLLIDSLKIELKEVKALLALSENAASDVADATSSLKSQLEQMEVANSNSAKYAQSIDKELIELQSDLKNSREEACKSHLEVEKLSSELVEVQSEFDKLIETECKARIDIAMLKAELHKLRSKIAAAEVREARFLSIKSGLYQAVKDFAIEAQKAKCEASSFNPAFASPSEDLQSLQDEQQKGGASGRIADSLTHITISLEEYKYLIKKAEEVDQVSISLHNQALPVTSPESALEADALKEELENASIEIIKLKSVAEKAVSRAESAEKAKTAVEGQLRKWREQKQKKREALDAFRQESRTKAWHPPNSQLETKSYLPLGKVLNMQF